MITYSGAFFVLFFISFHAFGQQPTVAWAARYNGLDNKSDAARQMVMDAQGNVYVTGISTTKNGSTLIATVKYNAQGVQQWVAQYTGPVKGDNYPYALATDANGNVYVPAVVLQIIPLMITLQSNTIPLACNNGQRGTTEQRI